MLTCTALPTDSINESIKASAQVVYSCKMYAGVQASTLSDRYAQIHQCNHPFMHN